MKVCFHHKEFKNRRTQELQKKAQSYSRKLKRYKDKHTTDIPEYALFVAGDSTYQKAVQKSLKPIVRPKHVVLVGIGGSSLGTEAVYQALAYRTSPALSIIDSIDRESLEKCETLLESFKNPTDVALVVVSKSGTTTETLTNAARVLELSERALGKEFKKQIVFVSDPGTALLKLGKKHKIVCIPMPESIGGRFSVFSAVGMVPLTLLNIDVTSLCEGATAALQPKEVKRIEECATTLALYAEEGMRTVNFFTFNKRLAYCGYWYRQLLAESIGKNMTTTGTSFQHQLLPIVSTSVDLHSMAQLYLSGYKDLYTMFVYFDDRHPYHVSIKEWVLEHTPGLRDKSIHEINDAILHAVFQAYKDKQLPYRITELPRCSAYEIGFLLATLMAEVMYLAHLLNVDAFNQPHVEGYKKYTRIALGVS